MEIVKLIYNKYLEFRFLFKLYKYVYNNGIRGFCGGKFDFSFLFRIFRNLVYVKVNDEILDYFKNSGMDVVGILDRKCGIFIYVKNIFNLIVVIVKYYGVIEFEIWFEV